MKNMNILVLNELFQRNRGLKECNLMKSSEVILQYFRKMYVNIHSINKFGFQEHWIMRFF
jgi:hypothetical protein